MNMAQIVISGVDEGAKRNFEWLCSNGANEANLFNIFVDFCMSFNKQGLLLNTASEVHQQTPSQIAAAKFLAASRKIAEQGFTAEDEDAFKRLDNGEYKLKFQDRGLV